MKTTPDWQFATGAPVPEHGRKVRIVARVGVWLVLLDLLAVIAAPLARMYLNLAGMTAFTIFFTGILSGLLLAGAALIFSVVTAIMGVPPAWKRGLLVTLLGLLPLAGVAVFLGPGRLQSPMIHDISTDTDDPPVFVQARQLRTPQENSLDYGGAPVAQQQHMAYPDIKPVIDDLSREEALTRVVQVVLGLNWTLVNADFDTGIVEAYDTTRVFGFVDDIVIRVRAHGGGSRIDIRSVSRVGLGDAGMNAARIRSFIVAF
jgi:uncharacterized protein (DUF1499 family)